MEQNAYSRLLVAEPVPGTGGDEGLFTYLGPDLVPEADCLVKGGWVRDEVSLRPFLQEHTHERDEIMILFGGRFERPQVLGAEVGLAIGGQRMVLTTTTGLYLPAGVAHGLTVVSRIGAPFMVLSLSLPPLASVRRPGTGTFDYEQYVIRSPMREAGAEFTAGRTAPTMTYMSGVQIPGVETYIEFGWTFGQPASTRTRNAMPSMAHRDYEEVVLHLGGDPAEPLDLGGDIEFVVGGQPLRFSTSSALFIPRGVEHGPIRCLAYRKPHIVMAVMLGAGSLKEGWEGSFREEKEA